MTKLTVTLPDALLVEIEVEARLRNVTKSEIVREHLERAISVRATLLSRMEDLVVEGESLPGDLSSNKEHLRRYGKNRSQSR